MGDENKGLTIIARVVIIVCAIGIGIFHYGGYRDESADGTFALLLFILVIAAWAK